MIFQFILSVMSAKNSTSLVDRFGGLSWVDVDGFSQRALSHMQEKSLSEVSVVGPSSALPVSDDGVVEAVEAPLSEVTCEPSGGVGVGLLTNAVVPPMPAIFSVRQSCPHCHSYKSSIASTFDAHVKVCSRKRFECEDCFRRYTTSYGLKKHRQVSCLVTGQPAKWATFFEDVGFWAARSYSYPYRFFCMVCGRYSSEDAGSLKKHLKMCLLRGSRIRCSGCGEIGMSDMRCHLLRTCSERYGPYYCPLCGDLFSCKMKFAMHLISEAGRLLRGDSSFLLPRILKNTWTSKHLPKVTVFLPTLPTSFNPEFRVHCPFCEPTEIFGVEEFLKHVLHCNQIARYPVVKVTYGEAAGDRSYACYDHAIELYRCVYCHVYVSCSLVGIERHSHACYLNLVCPK